ncbi:TCP-1/cpn60 chaperonin family protein [Pseudogemmobacter bohemicus]|uniref:TCP-1/cpn60 chaperonin family protein n=1 Tax=Pseudogemmobacter bohemicus TaxID=2250708 RepID=UPI001300AE96|nr:TCP-1/cpn60 chaperonin family protein [Pseudogemmobacter bohemicus]
MTQLTLNKITAQRGISVGEATKRISDLGWNPSYVQEAATFPTDYKIAKAPRDPMKQVLRSYFPMQEEKDNRVYGALDAALRGDMFRNVEPRWVEWMKLFLAIIPFPEISAARSMAMVARIAPGEDLRTGFTMQMVDEFRHSTIQMNLKKWYMENYIDPAGFDITEEAFGKCYATTIGRQFGEGFITGDVMTSACMYLTVVAETAFTNTLFVAMPSEAARNGDYALPTVFLSVQSDESRHIGNGHSLLMAALKEPENHLLLERDLRYAFWQNHAIVDAAIGTLIEYGTREQLGAARQVRASASQTTVIGGAGDAGAITARRLQVQRQYDIAPPNIEQDKLRERLAKLSGGTAVIHAGGLTPVEQKRKIQLIEDSLYAIRAAVEEGVVPGGGSALAHTAPLLDAVVADASGDVAAGIELVRSVLTRPLARIALNAGSDPNAVIAEVVRSESGVGFDASQGKFRDMIEAGIVDPVRVTCSALANAASVAALILTTETLIGHAEDYVDPTAGPALGGGSERLGRQ